MARTSSFVFEHLRKRAGKTKPRANERCVQEIQSTFVLRRAELSKMNDFLRAHNRYSKKKKKRYIMQLRAHDRPGPASAGNSLIGMTALFYLDRAVPFPFSLSLSCPACARARTIHSHRCVERQRRHASYTCRYRRARQQPFCCAHPSARLVTNGLSFCRVSLPFVPVCHRACSLPREEKTPLRARASARTPAGLFPNSNDDDDERYLYTAFVDTLIRLSKSC